MGYGLWSRVEAAMQSIAHWLNKLALGNTRSVSPKIILMPAAGHMIVPQCPLWVVRHTN
jgi:hypothetical protein